ncbi:MAG: cytochrome c3 family protein [Phycisphaeraceae bacterium]|nr:cytochrome c3 family protein [Phycisphaeraceae bacterium]
MRELTKHLNILIAVLAVTLFTSVSFAGIVGSDHDFSGAGWNATGGQICQPCHTPHGADTTIAGSPLWNRIPTTATYTTHAGSGQAATAIDDNSRLCLSCHDGTIAMDNFGGNTSGTAMITGAALLGTDLSNDHPIGADAVWSGTYDAAAAPGSQWTAEKTYMVSQNTRDTANIMPLRPVGTGNPAVGCTSCHEPHNRNSQSNMLWMSNAASALCLNCHVK